MATGAIARPREQVREVMFLWEGRDKQGRVVKGEMRAGGESVVAASLRRRGIIASKIRKQSFSRGRRITEKDLALFTRQLSTMLRAGVPLMQSFDIVGRGHANPSMSRLINDIRMDVETGTSLNQAFRKYPMYFDALFCNLVAAGEQAGILETLLDRLALYKEKTLALKGKIKKALFYPTMIILVSIAITAIIMIFVIPSFKQVFASFGADLPAPTLFVMAMSDFFVKYWYVALLGAGGGFYFAYTAWKRSPKVQMLVDRLLLKPPVIGELITKASIARWSRTLSTTFAAGVPLVEALDSVGPASGNAVYKEATKLIQNEVNVGTSLAVAMQNSGVFPPMAVQMTSIGEESGSLDSMLSKVADYYEREVDEAVDAMASLLEPLIMVVLGVVIGGIVVAIYLPIFKLGQVV
ncbi:MAG: type II secretion system F family protein [Burkholderiales bacterium]|jgi:type IV pilus assembly protein PilC|nr:type II secretion system F family protein [Burkholderiales bacterium]MCA3223999.1 type II secretion system F family protein [Burkholderiales bacterium]MCE2645037.1 type II secretion system F family protein [Burkholderiaceae bacterium]